MAKILFDKTVKYQGSLYPPNTAFQVSDDEIADLVKAGGWIISKETQTALDGSIDDKLDNDDVEDDTSPEKSELDLLREKATELGIEFKGNWGVKKLTEAIAAVEG